MARLQTIPLYLACILPTLLVGCDQTSEECVKQLPTLSDLCPAGTSINLTSEGGDSCNADTSQGESDDDEYTAMCVSVGSCSAKCELTEINCPCGFASISRVELKCNPQSECPASCGDGACGGDETWENCALDCEAPASGSDATSSISDDMSALMTETSARAQLFNQEPIGSFWLDSIHYQLHGCVKTTSGGGSVDCVLKVTAQTDGWEASLSAGGGYGCPSPSEAYDELGNQYEGSQAAIANGEPRRNCAKRSLVAGVTTPVIATIANVQSSATTFVRLALGVGARQNGGNYNYDQAVFTDIPLMEP